jgi:beta-glucosidase
LSYTTYRYGDAKLSATKIKRNQKLTVEITVTNSGAVKGKETMLWFISDPAASITRPMKELKFFEKKEIKAGATAVYKFEIDPMRDLSFTDGTGKRLLEAGDFILQVGNQKLKFELVD